jgi:iron-sulfur cluster assembly protein
MQDDGFDAATDYVRVGVKSGGCSGLSYDLKFDKNKEMMIKYSLTMI